MIVEGNYKITRLDSENLNPEDTLVDAMSDHSSIEIPISPRVFRFFYAIIGFVVVFFAIKSFELQVVNGAALALTADRNSRSYYDIPSVRGIIYDVKGDPLVENIPILNLVGVGSEFSKNKNSSDASLVSLSEVLEIPAYSIATLFDENKQFANFIIKSNISKEEAIKVHQLNISGIYIVPFVQRHYMYGSVFAHVLGYTAKVNPDDIKGDSYYTMTDRLGRLGLEAYYEKALRGEHEKVQLDGNILPKNDIFEGGDNLYLTIDREVQQKLYKTLESIIRSAGLKRGSSIVQNIKTGEVMGLVSIPSFDPNIFEDSSNVNNQQTIINLLNDKNRPLFNRIISGLYSPGSTFKPLLALIGLQEKVITPSTIIYSSGSIKVQSVVDPKVFYTFNDWKAHGATNLRKAIADSVDVYFYTVGGGYGDIKGVGIETISRYLKQHLMDSKLGIDLPNEKSGVVPDNEWKQSVKGESWFIGDTYNISIGQGDLLATPLWLNAYTGAIANGGKLMKPFIVNSITGLDGKLKQKIEPEVLVEMAFEQKHIRAVQDAMRSTVTDGTALLLKDLPKPVASKTGTVQIGGKELNSLITVWGPYGDPDIAMTVVIEGTRDKYGLVHQVAHDFLMWYFNEHESR